MTKEEIVKELRTDGAPVDSIGYDTMLAWKRCNQTMFAAADLIEQQAARIEELEAKVPRWIPVNERLPETAGSYIVYTESGNVAKVNFYPDLGRFQRIFTHWMPLPEVPKGGNDGTINI